MDLMTKKDWLDFHKKLVKAVELCDKAQTLVKPYQSCYMRITVHPLTVTVSNIYEVQDALGGEIQYIPWYGQKYTEAHLYRNGIDYMCCGLSQEQIDERRSVLDYPIPEV